MTMSGAKINKVGFKYAIAPKDTAFEGDGSRGVYAIEDIKEGEMLMVLPEKSLLTLEGCF